MLHLHTRSSRMSLRATGLTTLREKAVKIGAKVVARGRYVVFQMAEVAVPREFFRRILARIEVLRRSHVARCDPWRYPRIITSEADVRLHSA